MRKLVLNLPDNYLSTENTVISVSVRSSWFKKDPLGNSIACVVNQRKTSCEN